MAARRRRRISRPSAARAFAAGLQQAFRIRCTSRYGIADVDLAAGDVVFAAVESGGFGQSGDSVLGGRVGGGVGARGVGRDGAVVDDPAAHRGWLFISLNASCVQRNRPVRLTSTTDFHCSDVTSSSGVRSDSVPALLNSTSSRPNFSLTAANRARTDSGCVTSVVRHRPARGLPIRWQSSRALLTPPGQRHAISVAQ